MTGLGLLALSLACFAVILCGSLPKVHGFYRDAQRATANARKQHALAEVRFAVQHERTCLRFLRVQYVCLVVVSTSLLVNLAAILLH